MIDKDKVDEMLDALCYLDWYFNEDNGEADKEAVAAYNTVRPIIFNWIDREKRKPRYIHIYNKDGKEIGSLEELNWEK